MKWELVGTPRANHLHPQKAVEEGRTTIPSAHFQFGVPHSHMNQRKEKKKDTLVPQ